MLDHATELAAALSRTEEALDNLSRQVTVNEYATRRANLAARTALAVMVLIILVGGFVWDNQIRIDELQHRQQIQTDRNKTAQCAMNALLLQYASRTTVSPNYSEEQRKAQGTAAAELARIGADLQCP